LSLHDITNHGMMPKTEDVLPCTF